MRHHPRSQRLQRFLCGAAIVIAAAVAEAGGPTTFFVTTTADAGPGSLREAIDQSNVNGFSVDTIAFSIPPAECSPEGVCTISLASSLPLITDGVVIDGTTQPASGTAPNNVCATASAPSRLRVQIDADSSVTVFHVASPDPTVIRGIAFVGGSGVVVDSFAAHHIACNHFGINAEGTALASGNPQITHVGFDFGAGGVVVGTDGDGVEDVAERNLFGGNFTGIYINANSSNTVAGNWFGLAADGTTVLGVREGVLIRQSSSSNLVGSNLDGVSDHVERNVFAGVSGFSSSGINFPVFTGGTGNRVVGNWFGVDAYGQAAPGEIGIALTDPGAGTVIERNWFANHSVAALAIGGSSGLEPSGLNCFEANAAAVVHDGSAVAVDLAGNWWGDASGPAGIGPGSGDPIAVTGGGSVAFTPWLTAQARSCGAVFADGFESAGLDRWSSSQP
ncbi:MAG TPA: hypothetical protein VLB51_02990 [Methylomirabilota bacterium]|nr:hypothetical protein [Methylomirabilota bacterium]